MVQERTVSVRPSRNKRVMEASYVRQNFPLSWRESRSSHYFFALLFLYFNTEVQKDHSDSMVQLSGSL